MLVDARPMMRFGTRDCFKSVLAAQLASLLAWSALDAGDRVGGLVFNGASHREIRPRRSRKTVLALLSQIAQYNRALPLALANVLQKYSGLRSLENVEGAEAATAMAPRNAILFCSLTSSPRHVGWRRRWSAASASPP